MHLWRSLAAVEQMASAKPKKALFFSGICQTADYFIRNVLPVTLGRLDSVINGSKAAVEIDTKAFG
jgi:hypothetical protein